MKWRAEFVGLTIIRLWYGSGLIGAVCRNPGGGWRFITRTAVHKSSRKSWPSAEQAAASILGHDAAEAIRVGARDYEQK